MNHFDITVFQWFNAWAGVSPFFDTAILFRAHYLPYALVAGLGIFLVSTFHPRLVSRRAKHIELVLVALASGIIARYAVTLLIREFYSRPRPFEVIEGVRQILSHSPGGSFPSGHVSFAFAIATAVSFYYPKTSLLFFAAALSIGLGRVAAGIHWPSDILGGVAVGILSAWILRVAWKTV